MIVRDPNKCIHCYRCIRGCNDLVVNDVLDMAYREPAVAGGVRPGPAAGRIVVRRVRRVRAALSHGRADREEGRSRRGRSWDLEKVRTTCPYCGVGCQVYLHVDRGQNRVVKVTGVEGAPPNDGMLCVKGRFAYDFPASPRRLTQPHDQEGRPARAGLLGGGARLHG